MCVVIEIWNGNVNKISDEPIRVEQLGLMITKEDAIEMMKEIYL